MLKITEFRKEQGLTQNALAEKLNISVKKLGAWEQERAEPCIDDLCMIADFFDCTLDELVGRVQLESGAVHKGLTPQEIALIERFRKLSDKERQQALNILEALNLNI